MLLVYYTRNLIDGVYHLKIVTRSMSQLRHLKTFFELTINYFLFYEMIIGVIQFCNGNCSATKLRLSFHREKENKNTLKAPIIYRKI